MTTIEKFLQLTLSTKKSTNPLQWSNTLMDISQTHWTTSKCVKNSRNLSAEWCKFISTKNKLNGVWRKWSQSTWLKKKHCRWWLVCYRQWLSLNFSPFKSKRTSCSSLQPEIQNQIMQDLHYNINEKEAKS